MGSEPMSSAGCNLTFMMAVYGQPEMMRKWWETLCSYDDDVLDRLHLVIVDDHGDPPQKIPPDIQASIKCQLLRVTQQIHWNQMGARNLGMDQATTDWVVMLDPDMVIELPVAKRLLVQVAKMKQGQVLKLFLRYTNDVSDGSSPNVYMIHRADFHRVQGYDEDYAGNKGWSDVQFMHTLTAAKFQLLQYPNLWVRYYRPRDIQDATVKTLSRDVRINKELHLRKMAQLKMMGVSKFVRQRKPNLRFTWKRLI